MRDTQILIDDKYVTLRRIGKKYEIMIQGGRYNSLPKYGETDCVQCAIGILNGIALAHFSRH